MDVVTGGIDVVLNSAGNATGDVSQLTTIDSKDEAVIVDLE
ncbi:hypothetical protein C5167_042055 [Papaver somniferum]|nr:hypothetical protein C5167_042055 [Papaver somniferum]